jgi:hypothetical protein
MVNATGNASFTYLDSEAHILYRLGAGNTPPSGSVLLIKQFNPSATPRTTQGPSITYSNIGTGVANRCVAMDESGDNMAPVYGTSSTNLAPQTPPFVSALNVGDTSGGPTITFNYFGLIESAGSYRYPNRNLYVICANVQSNVQNSELSLFSPITNITNIAWN